MPPPPPPRFWFLHSVSLLLLGLVFVSLEGVDAYVPAVGTNDTNAVLQNGQNGSDGSMLNLQWYPNSQSSEPVSYQLVGATSTGVNKGALVHFSETNLTNSTIDMTITPWIALVSCDDNATDASLDVDIFTLAQERGAVAALLYSTRSQACLINPHYADPAFFDQVMDIFSTENLASSQAIEETFGRINDTIYGDFNAKLLNESFNAINSTILNGTVNSPGYLFASLIAANATDVEGGEGSTTPTSSTNSSPGGGGPNTSLAMIILYAITGCVSALFCVVIVSGAVRAIRHPERYGPRTGEGAFNGPPGAFNGPQSRARGLARAILDTFPVVKYGGNEAAPGADTATQPKDLEAGAADTSTSTGSAPVDEVKDGEILELDTYEHVDYPPASPGAARPMSPVMEEPRRASGSGLHDGHDGSDESPGAGSSRDVGTVVPRPRPQAGSRQDGKDKDIMPDAIGRETCPICIVDFEEGDDLRILPCEGHHRFHRECVDQWLLELSSSCPLCRQDFHVLETLMAGDMGEHLEPPRMPGASSSRPLSTAGARFSRYLRMARRRQRGRRDDLLGYDPTNPPMPMAPETRL
ncbi:hypothetical protein CERSUDRAFT_114486 [Gelatoporia subvermispora B]|uniref:RING-type domain-containing protein n=1 Tax=Ceriporiopsis subvermispora (strain B) TaxID=914234 RepID=M2RH74_CERS8|nr:hypothetical protein CERSUDRAFT_114486 [Gelatoporia subvermispora B]